ncbi:flagellin [Acidicapsa dinghuensis]|uniref:Flagellin n=1 Tax=Acidicapsa dinghuensis TaxID=2218256 RepID=A0ABW1ELA0_9BACT|nr:flagellin [Acidicapsa dinghuensis]
MSLGVLNNIAALYAENSLNNTNDSLQNVLTQLSSGSKINSGSDDAAGLSLINGLQANATALTQSSTNATEGVGLLQVADGALSQVTNLLNRAVTLATEVSNGTLNSTQDAAANQEYQSILSEITSIGQTTTYNSQQVFTGAAAGTNIYTGDSSTSGSSIDNLYFAPLSSSTVGDSGGTVVQSSAGQFFDLSLDTSGSLTTAAQSSDNLTAGASLVFTVTNADGTTSTVTTTATTVGGLISEINKDGIAGVSASLTTASAVGDAGVAAADTGILISNTNSNVSIAEGTTSLEDATTVQTAAPAAFTSTKATETISYQKGANEQTTDLATSDLTSEGNAQAALLQLNSAISNVAAQRGYLGAQVNTLNAVSQVVDTQQENITSAQNAVQATDYASATTALSKYEILSQTGISALAQANSIQQEVTKLLQ